MSEPTDTEMAALMVRLVESLDLTCADGRAGSEAILREIEARAPGTLARLRKQVCMRGATAR